MPMNKVQKNEWAKSFRADLDKANVSIFTNYSGLSAPDADDLRAKLREKDCIVKILKNNIARKAVVDHPSEETKKLLDDTTGPILVAFAMGDPAAAAKVIHDFSKDNDALKLRESILDGKRVEPAQIKALALLPSREVLLAQLLSTMNGTARGFVSVLAAVPRDFVGVLAALQRKKEESGS